MQMVAEKCQTKVRRSRTRCRGALERVPEPLIGDDADQAVLSIEQRLEYLELRPK